MREVSALRAFSPQPLRNEMKNHVIPRQKKNPVLNLAESVNTYLLIKNLIRVLLEFPNTPKSKF